MYVRGLVEESKGGMLWPTEGASKEGGGRAAGVVVGRWSGGEVAVSIMASVARGGGWWCNHASVWWVGVGRARRW